MESSLLSSEFPHLSSSSAAATPVSLRNWNQIFAPNPSSASKVFNFLHHPSEPDIIPFSSEKLAKGGDDWRLCLVGYSIGRRPFYEALLGAINKTWNLKGSLQLLSLSDGFFLFRFSCVEDYDMAWSKGVWFLLGKPFVLQKWHPKFKPKRENFATVPIWVKIHDLPLACWNSEGISRIASKIGVPLAADHLTEQKTRLTFARVCVLVDCNATYPDFIKVSLDGDIVELKVQYEWRPVLCEHCKSLVHYSSSCPQNPKSSENDMVNNFPKTRGRSFSKKPTNRFSSKPPTNNRPPRSDSRPKDGSIPTIAGPSSTPTSPKHLNSIGQPLHYQAHSPPPTSNKDILQSKPLAEDMPSKEISDSSSSMKIISHNQSTAITSPNKFEIFNSQTESDLQEVLVTENDLVGNSLKQPGKSKKQPTLDMLCLLETRIHAPSLVDPFFDSAHSLFPNEASINNFNLSSSGRIWVKWNSEKLAFSPTVVTTQLINGLVTVGNLPPFQLSIVYAANSFFDRKELWASICQVAPSSTLPWAVLGDFNCCRYANEKSGGSALHHSSLVDLNSMIFANSLMDLHSVGNFFTWFNQQASNPIFIKLDRALVNDDWVKNFPSSFCSYQSPSCSDHSPIILHSGDSSTSHHRFLFKNFWTKHDRYWSFLLNALSLPLVGNPLSHFCNVLKCLKGDLKNHDWANSNSLDVQLEALHVKQQSLLHLIQNNPSEAALLVALKDINLHISEVSSMKAIERRRKKRIAKIMGINMVDEMEYLGTKIALRRLRKVYFQILLDSCLKILNAWGNRCISLVGRLVLVKMVFINLPLFFMPHSLVPLSILKEFEKLYRNFIWNKHDGSHGMHYVAWEVLCKPKALGGWGIQSAVSSLEPLRAKFAWKLLVNPTSGKQKFIGQIW
ncbi:uncharacterized protein LOC110096650 [Dendrobium catenatum]|uniref:uncharacterized protein LOC110096650 n=1 Tax=Dendrobium catenatum TaxID=906689 RepID=UPI00109F80BC|nr:uncharacterized protein LOC110096650 [Dendrobium catenatum]